MIVPSLSRPRSRHVSENLAKKHRRAIGSSSTIADCWTSRAKLKKPSRGSTKTVRWLFPTITGGIWSTWRRCWRTLRTSPVLWSHLRNGWTRSLHRRRLCWMTGVVTLRWGAGANNCRWVTGLVMTVGYNQTEWQPRPSSGAKKWSVYLIRWELRCLVFFFSIYLPFLHLLFSPGYWHLFQRCVHNMGLPERAGPRETGGASPSQGNPHVQSQCWRNGGLDTRKRSSSDFGRGWCTWLE